MDETPRQFKEKSRECEYNNLHVRINYAIYHTDTYGILYKLRSNYPVSVFRTKVGLLVSYETTGPYPSLSGVPGSNLCIVTCLRYHEKICVKAKRREILRSLF